MMILGFVGASGCLWAQSTAEDAVRTEQLDEVTVSAVRADGRAPVAYVEVDQSAIREGNAVSNIPYVLWLSPSVVAFSENGTATGNTSMRIRGTSASRINVTMNGIPQNNPESQEVFWVNLPALSYSVKDIQIQRGVGTSTNGPGAFGAGVHMKTVLPSVQPWFESSATVGSYNTYETVLAGGTGYRPSGWSVDARYARVESDGYVRNGSVDHQSLYASVSRRTEKDWLQLLYLWGEQHTGITWEGATPQMLAVDRRYNPSGLWYDTMDNEHYYDNETDNYYQDVAQAVYTRKLPGAWMLNTALNYTHGYGYYENYKMAQKFSKFGLPAQTPGSQTFDRTDLIRRKFMNNDYYVGTASLRYQDARLIFQSGGMYSYYDGDHYGRLLWLMVNESVDVPYQWYRNRGVKEDANVFARAEYTLAQGVHAFADVQFRHVGYRLQGEDDDRADLTQNHAWNFFNPKAGLFYAPSQAHKWYASFSVANREPSRADIKDIPKYGGSDVVRPERLLDYELGYRYARGKYSLGVNLYYMDYKDQLVSTGRLTDVGYALMENVPESYRAGVELSAGARPLEWLSLDANLTLSRNKIRHYTQWLSMYDNPDNWNELPQQAVYRGTTDISFSPDVVAGGMIALMPARDWKIVLGTKWVGAQYFDNSSDPESRLSPYMVMNLQISYAFTLRQAGRLEVALTANNLLNRDYSANAWGYASHFEDGSAPDVVRSYFVQAPRNFAFRVSFKF